MSNVKEVSFELLSTMSPRTNHTRKPNIQHPTKLALKRNVRRSSISDKKSTLDFTGTSETTNVNRKLPEFSTEKMGKPTNESAEVNSLIEKYLRIDQWLSDNQQVSEFSNISSRSESDIKLKHQNSHLLENTNWSMNSYNEIRDLQSENSTLLLDEKEKDSSTSTNDSDNSYSENCLNKSDEAILDSIYGKSWRKQNKNVIRKNNAPGTNKPNKQSQNNINQLDKLNMKRPKNVKASNKLNSQWQERFKSLCDSDSSSSNSNSEDFDQNDDEHCENEGNSTNCSDTFQDLRSHKQQVGTSEHAARRKPNYKDDNDQRKPARYSFLKSLSLSVPPYLCDPDAKYYRENFKKSKDLLVKQLFSLYNEKIFDKHLPSDLLIQWNSRLTKTAGLCRNRRTISSNGVENRTSRIVLSAKVLESADRVRDTLIHELCHAATWILNKEAGGHGPFWKSWARKAMNVFPELPPIRTCHDFQISTKYTYKCTKCAYSIGRHSKSLNTEKKRCGYCYGKFELLINTVSKEGEKKQVPESVKKKQPSAFALYVKDNYGLMRSQGTKHVDVMKALGQNFAALKLIETKD